MSGRVTCPRCQAPLAADAPAGLCPRCLFAEHFGTGRGETEPSAAEQVPTAQEIGRMFPQLEIISCLGRGGMGVVYKARQPSLDRFVALKILSPAVSDKAEFASRFAHEAKALAKLSHPAIVTLYEFGRVPEGPYYFLMEYVDGVNLRQLLEGVRISPREALAIIPQICDALQYAHDEGVVHRDVKPENLLIDRRGRVKIADFGLAKLASGDTRSVGEKSDASASPAGLSQAGTVLGTPAYMAPEQRDRPTEVDHRADIYALGVVLYQLLTGKLPGDPLQLPSRILQVDVRLDEIVLRALERNPEQRFQNATEVKTRIEQLPLVPRTPTTWPKPASARSPQTPASARRAWRPIVIGGLAASVMAAATTVAFLMYWAPSRPLGVAESPAPQSGAQPKSAPNGPEPNDTQATAATRALVPPPSHVEPASPDSAAPTREFLESLSDPATVAAQSAKVRAEITRRYGPYADQLQLPPDKRQQFLDLLVDRNLAATDITMALVKNNDPALSDPAAFSRLVTQARRDYETQLHALLGDDGYAGYRQWDVTVGQSTVIARLQDTLRTSSPLSDDQVAQLRALLEKTGTGHVTVNVVTDAQAQGFLDATQLKALQDLYASQQNAQLRRRIGPMAGPPAK